MSNQVLDDLRTKVGNHEPKALIVINSVLNMVSTDQGILYLTILWRMNCTGIRLMVLHDTYADRKLDTVLEVLGNIDARNQFVYTHGHMFVATPSSPELQSQYSGWETDLRALHLHDTSELQAVAPGVWKALYEHFAHRDALLFVLFLHHMNVRGERVEKALGVDTQHHAVSTTINNLLNPNMVEARAKLLTELREMFSDDSIGIYPGWSVQKDYLWGALTAFAIDKYEQLRDACSAP